MAVADRTARGHIQRVVGELGEVAPYRWNSGNGHRAPGWYVTPAAAVTGCRCAYCTAARAGADLYLGYHVRDAIVDAELAARQHRGGPT